MIFEDIINNSEEDLNQRKQSNDEMESCENT